MKIQNLKLKAVFVSQDGGKNWLCVRQHYLTDLRFDKFLDDTFQGETFILKENTMEENDDKRNNNI